MTGFSGYMKPVVNPIDGVAEFRWSTITERTLCKYSFPPLYRKIFLTSRILVPLIDPADLGPVVRALLATPEAWDGAEVPVVGDVLTIPQVAEIYTEVTGNPARAVFVAHVPQEGIPQWTERHRAYRDGGYFPKYVGREQEAAR